MLDVPELEIRYDGPDFNAEDGLPSMATCVDLLEVYAPEPSVQTVDDGSRARRGDVVYKKALGQEDLHQRLSALNLVSPRLSFWDGAGL